MFRLLGDFINAVVQLACRSALGIPRRIMTVSDQPATRFPPVADTVEWLSRSPRISLDNQ